MAKIVSPAINWLTASEGSTDPSIHRRERRTAAAIFLGLICLTLSVIILVATRQTLIAFAPLLAIIALIICGFALRAGASIDVISNAVITIIAIMVFSVLLATGGASVGSLIAIPIIPTLATLVGNHRSVLLWSILTVAVIVLVIALTLLEFTFPIQPDPGKVAIAKFFIAIVVVGMVFGHARILLSDQQRTEQALLESERLFNQAAHTAGLGHYVWDEIRDRFISVSDEYCAILGITLDDLLTHYNSAEQYLTLVHPDDLEKIRTDHTRLTQQGKGHDIRYRVIRPDGEVRCVRDVEDPILRRHGGFVQTVGILQDVTKEVESRHQLEESEALLKQAVRTAKLGHCSFDLSVDEYINVSPEYARIFGYTVDGFLKRFRTLEKDMELVHPNDRDRVEQAYEDREHRDIEYRIIRSDGSIRNVIEQRRSATDSAGNHTGHNWTLQDITEVRHFQERARELKEAQQESARNLADVRQAAQLVKLGTYVWDWTKDKLISCSEEYARMHELSVDDAIEIFSSAEADYGYIHPDDRQRMLDLEDEAERKEVGYSANYRMLLPSGRICHVREVCEVELDEQGEAHRTFGTIQDVTDQVELEKQLRQSRKMEAVGQLTSGIAHDFNNILAIVIGNLELAIENTKENSIDREMLSDAMQGAQQGADLNKQLLTFSRQDVLAERVVNVNEIIQSMSSLLARTLGEEFEVEMDYGEESCFCDLDPALLESTILNLAINARDAMVDGGTLHITTRTSLSSKLTDNVGVIEELIHISVSDCGTGMSTEVKEHALEPFFTTKEIGTGSGLGLSMVYGFVTQSGGRMEIESDLGAGTTVHMILPSASRHDEVLGVLGDSKMPMAVDGEVVLVVEDQPEVRDVVVRQLGKLGYEVLEAADGKNAVKIMESRERIDLILSDMVLPGGMGGEEVVSKAIAIIPNIRALFMSGNPARADGIDGKISAPLLQKPFRQLDLARAVRDRMDDR